MPPSLPRCLRLATLLLLPTLLAAQPAMQLGVNLDNMGAFVNIVKHTNRYSGATSYDAQGWPASDFELVLMDGRPVAEWAGVIDDPDAYRIDYSGRYACSFSGSASMRATGTMATIENIAHDASTNTTTFDLVVGGWPGPNHGLVFLQFTNTRRTPASPLNSGITQLRVNRPGYPLATTDTFTREYLALCRAADFACFRFYNVQNIWDGEPVWPARTTWSMRKMPDDAAQVSMESTNGKRDGWCWEHIVELANILKKDIWICIHQSCDSMYVAQLAAMLRDGLDPAIVLYVESSNEVWSPTQATHGPWNQADAQDRGITFDQNHARRTVELSRWFGAVFGPGAINGRVRIILAGQHAYAGRSDNHLDYIATHVGPPREQIYATSTALYFGSTNASSPDTARILAGMMDDITAQIADPEAATYRLRHIRRARDWRLLGGCTSYEGGPSLPEGGSTVNLSAQILAHRTAGMGDVVRCNYGQGWRDLGGGLALYFTLASAYTRHGCWGITDDPSKPDRTAKMQAIRDIIAGTATDVESVPPSDAAILQAWPNPMGSALFVSCAVATVVEVSDVLGRRMWSGTVSTPLRIDASAWRPGVYMLRHAGGALLRVKRGG